MLNMNKNSSDQDAPLLRRTGKTRAFTNVRALAATVWNLPKSLIAFFEQVSKLRPAPGACINR
jgi:hypothetical protein